MASKTKKQKYIEMYVAGIVLDPKSNSPIVVLKNDELAKCLPIWIGVSEATSIASSIKGLESDRPLSHDLFKNYLLKKESFISRVYINELINNTFYSSIVFVDKSGDEFSLDSRPSDAISLALRFSAVILVEEEVYKSAAVELVDEEDLLSSDREDEIFADFEDVKSDNKPGESLQNKVANLEELDKEELLEILETMSPEDFKYKM